MKNKSLKNIFSLLKFNLILNKKSIYTIILVLFAFIMYYPINFIINYNENYKYIHLADIGIISTIAYILALQTIFSPLNNKNGMIYFMNLPFSRKEKFHYITSVFMFYGILIILTEIIIKYLLLGIFYILEIEVKLNLLIYQLDITNILKILFIGTLFLFTIIKYNFNTIKAILYFFIITFIIMLFEESINMLESFFIDGQPTDASNTIYKYNRHLDFKYINIVYSFIFYYLSYKTFLKKNV